MNTLATIIIVLSGLGTSIFGFFFIDTLIGFLKGGYDSESGYKIKTKIWREGLQQTGKYLLIMLGFLALGLLLKYAP